MVKLASTFVLAASAFFHTPAGQAAVCATDFDCFTPAQSVCVANTCVAGPSECIGDDIGDTSGADDGPAGARNLGGPVGSPIQLAGAICGTPSTEADYYSVTVAKGAGLNVNVSWSGEVNLDLAVYDSSGVAQGFSLHQSPEIVDLSYLPSGPYFLRVVNSTRPASTAANAYTITATTSVAQACTISADCGVTFSTQLFRSQCTEGACVANSAPANLALGASCDRDSNCASGLCSYFPFEAGAQRSECTTTCTSDAQCPSGLHCTQGLTPNRCTAACTSNLECGADTMYPVPDLGQPWSYYTCNVTAANCMNDHVFADGFES